MAKPYGRKDDDKKKTPSLTGMSGLEFSPETENRTGLNGVALGESSAMGSTEVQNNIVNSADSTNKYEAYFENLATQQVSAESKYAQYFRELEQNNLDQLNNSIRIASMGDADQAAEIQKLAQETGLDPSIIRGNVAEVKRQIELQNIDTQYLASQSPILAEQLRNSAFAAIAFDDTESLSAIEKTTHFLKGFWGSAKAGSANMAASTMSVLSAVPDRFSDYATFFGASEDNVFSKAAGSMQGQAKSWFELAEERQGDLSALSPKVQSFLQGVSSAFSMAPGFAATVLTKNPAFMAGTGGVLSGGMSYTNALDEGLDSGDALTYAMTQASIEIGTEYIPAFKLIENLKMGDSFFKSLMGQLAYELPQEQIATVLQEYTDLITLPSQAEMTFGDYLEQRPESAYHTLFATLGGVGTQTSIAYAGNYALNKAFGEGIEIDPLLKQYIDDNGRATEAQQVHASIVQLAEQIKESKTAQRDQSAIKAYIAELFQSQVEGETTPEVVVFYQDLVEYAEAQGIDLRDISPLINEQIDGVVNSAGYFSFKIEDYLTEIANGEHAEGMNQILRIHENAMSVAEASAWSKEANQDLLDQAETIIASMENRDIALGEDVYDEVVNQLTSIGVPREEANQSAALYKAFFVVMGDRAGVDPKQLFDRYNLGIQRNLPEGVIRNNQSQTLGELVDIILKPEEATDTKPKAETLEDLLQLDEAGNVLNRDEMIEAIMEGHFAETTLGEQAELRASQFPEDNDEYIIAIARKELPKINLENKQRILEEEQLEIKLKDLKEKAQAEKDEFEGTNEEHLEHDEKVVVPMQIDAMDAEIELLRFQMANSNNQNVVNRLQEDINKLLLKKAKLQDEYNIGSNNVLDFVEETAPEVVEATEEVAEETTEQEVVEETTETVTPEQTQQIRDYLEKEMGVDLGVIQRDELIDLIRTNFYDPQGRVLEQAAFHGTPFQGVIEQFSTDFIGTGEGAVAYGWGMYFASKEAVARHYMEADELDGDLYVDGEFIEQGHKDFDLFDYLEWQPGDSIDTLIDAIYEEKAHWEENLRYGEEVLEKLSAGEEVENWIWVGKGEKNTSLMLKTPQQKPWQGARLASFADSPINDDPFMTDQERNNRDGTALIGGLPSAKFYLVQYQRFADRWVVQARGDTKNDALDAYEAREIDYARQQIATRETDIERTKEYADAEVDVKTELGKIYKVDLKPAEEDYLIWDNELNDQSDKVKKVINKLIKKYKLGTAGGLNFGRDVYKHISYVDEIYANFETKTRWPEKEVASKFLLSEGIRGIKFADGRTRNRDDIKEKDYNYVIFDDKDVEITRVFNQSGIAVADNVAKFTDDRIERVIQEYRHPKQINASVVTINPADFVKAVTDPYYKDWLEKSFPEGVQELNAEELSSEEQTPFVIVSEVDGKFKIDGHEGRHRMQAMADAGITETPLVVRFRDASWADEKTESGLGQSGVLLGDDEKSGNNPNSLRYSNVVDIFQNSAEELKQVHGTGQDAKVFFQGAVEPQGIRDGEVIHYHSSPNIFDQFEINENRLKGTYLSGIYSHASKARTTGGQYGDNVYKIAVELGNVGVMWPYSEAKKYINQAMEDKYLEILNRYKKHVAGWAEAEAKEFRRSGYLHRFSGLEKREIWLAGGYDTVKDGDDYISLHPEAVRILEVNGKPAPPMREFYQSSREPSLEQKIAQIQGVPLPESDLLTTLHGRVENELQSLLDKVKGDAELLTTRRLSKVFGSPKKRKDKEKFDRNVRPTSYKDLKKMLDWALQNDSPGNWYKEFGEGFVNIVGKANLHEASMLFGITSAQNAAETNFSDTLHIMALARQFDPITQEKQFRKALRNKKRPGGQRLKITGRQIDAVVNMYKSGTYKGGLKVSTYMQLIRARGLNEFNPFSVQDVHMSRVFGYRYRDTDTKTGNVVDFAKFPSPAAIRYAMWMTNKLADEYGMRPDAVQANLWFYAKKNLTPKQSSGKKTVVGDGTYESAANYAAPEIEAIQSLVDAGTFDKNNALTTALETGERPNFKSDVISDPFSNSEFNDQLLALAEARAPRVLVSSNPGNARGYGFPEGTTLEQLRDYNQEVLAAITDEDGQIKLLREMGIVHKVGDTFGTFERVEPTFEITFPGETFETAQFASKLLGEALMQDGTITEKTSFDGQQFGILVSKADGSKFSTEDLTKIYQQVNPEQSMDGLNFTRTGDGTGLKFLDGKYFEDSSKYTGKDLEKFETLISQYFSNKEYNLGLIAQESEYYDHTERSRSNIQKTWNRSGTEGSSDLQRSAIRSLYQPIHEVYGNWQRRLDFKPQNETSALAELLEVSESELRKELQRETYNQQQRGSIQFRSNETIISLFEGADRSTFLHESGHLFLEVMRDLGEDPQAPETIKEEWQKILNFLEVKSGADIGVEQHEKWAESFEKYLFEGKAPSVELQGVFNRFKAWLKGVYQQLKNLNVEINDEIRGIFDRMLATPSQIKEAEEVSRFVPLFESLEKSGMTQSQWNDYQDTANRATIESEADLDRKKLNEVTREDKKWYREELKKVKAQVEDEVSKMPVYQVIHFLQTGEVLQGEALPGLEPMKLDKKALVDEFGEILNQLPRGRRIYSTKGGIHHDLVAEIFGFKSGMEMVKAIMNAQPRKKYIESVARERLMIAQKDMSLDRQKLEEEAIKSAHATDQRGRFLQIELAALAKSANMSGTPAAAARQAAINILNNKKVQEIQPGRYRAAEAAAGRATEKALAKNNFVEATKQARARLLNHYLYREAVSRQEEVDKFVRYFTRLQKPATRKRLARDYIDQIYTLLEKIDIKKSVTKKARERRMSFAKWVESQMLLGNEIAFSDEMIALLESSEKVHYKDMQFDELKAVYENIRSIEHNARWKQRLLDDRAKMDFDATVEEMVEVARREHKEWKVDKPDFTDSKLSKAAEAWQEFHASHDKIEYIAQAMDGYETNGVWHTTIFKPIADAEDAEAIMHETYIKKLNDIMTKHYTAKERRSWNKKVTTSQGTFNKRNILAMALNWGNEENRIALLSGFETKKGWKFTGPDVEAILNSNMQEKDWQMVQEVWDMIDELWPEIAALQKELTGIVPPKVEATPFDTPFGTMRGGYYPLSYDPDKSDKQRRRTTEEQIKDLFENSFSKAATKTGHTKERVGSDGQMVRLDLNVLSEHLHNVIHDLTHRKAIIQINKFLTDIEVQEAVQGVLGKKVYDAINPWLKAVAAPQQNYIGTLDRMANWTRHSATIVAMGFKVTTAMVQPLGYSQSVAYLGEKWAMKGLTSFYRNPHKNRNAILEKSVFMRNRTRTLDRDVRESMNRITGSQSRFKDMQSKYFFFIGFMDMTVSLPTWQAAYEKAIKEGLSEKEAIANGDQAVRMTQGSGGMKDLARVQQGTPTQKLFTMFYSYFSAYYNMSKRTIQMRKEGKISTFEAFRHFMWLTILPAVLSEIMLGRGPDEDDDESWAAWSTKTLGTYPFLGMVWVRDIANMMGNPNFGTALPYTDVIDSIVNAGWATSDLFTEDEFNEIDVKNIMLGISYALKIPGRQIANTFEHLYEVFSEGEDLSFFELLVKRDRDD